MNLTQDDVESLILLCEMQAMEFETNARIHAREGFSMETVRGLLANADSMRAIKEKLISMRGAKE